MKPSLGPDKTKCVNAQRIYANVSLNLIQKLCGGEYVCEVVVKSGHRKKDFIVGEIVGVLVEEEVIVLVKEVAVAAAVVVVVVTEETGEEVKQLRLYIKWSEPWFLLWPLEAGSKKRAKSH